jgi:hypothetical protein
MHRAAARGVEAEANLAKTEQLRPQEKLLLKALLAAKEPRFQDSRGLTAIGIEKRF